MLTLLFSLALAGDSDWSIEASFGDTHTVQIDVDEGTWLNVSAHGNTVVFDLDGVGVPKGRLDGPIAVPGRCQREE